MSISTKDILFGVTTGDAIGVPKEFCSREELIKNPVTDMTGYGTYNQKPGTWSDDGSMTLILAETLLNGLDKKEIINGFILWYKENYWTARGVMFDIGIQTRAAIEGLIENKDTDISSEYKNGNGSLMRILPLILITKDIYSAKERFQIVKEVSSITHGHIRSVIACYYYLEFARYIVKGEGLLDIYKKLQKEVPRFLEQEGIEKKEMDHFWKLFIMDLYKHHVDSIESDGYVVHSLEASIWCLLNTNSFKEAVLKAVNLGEDTDTTAAITGGLAGLKYGYQGIPKDWIAQIAKKEDINRLSIELDKKYFQN